MKTLNKNLIYLLAFTLFAVSCSKYEDGPVVSLIPKKDRITNYWKVEKAYEDGNDVTSSYEQYELELRNDNSATLQARYSGNAGTIIFETDGTWEFQNGKSDLKLDYENDEADETYIILRLTQEELWLLSKGDDVELRLEPK
ncbi:lipocalin family protein [Luteibaculum oceani]|uniref:Copper resistance protein NlpE n=1 Tax=Luteibaculum oceani TaxID=1294296 RepID=A0A5C6VB85_9FLAO|nr:copper resistance protein NlpE N-terminal domain-containing protein [Luteibaculum oceani]TXC81666.1 copper resistance protein NlpE [Luteibaculum oceani]